MAGVSVLYSYPTFLLFRRVSDEEIKDKLPKI